MADHWPEGGPRVVWEVKGLGGGFSNPVVAGGRVFVIGRKAKGRLKGWGSQECEPEPDVLSCLDRTNGKVLWRHEFPFHVKADKSTAWSTPAVDGDRVYARGGDGEVRCLSAQGGREVWSWPKDKELLKQKENVAHSGYAGALTVEGDLVIFQGLVPGGRKATLVAMDKRTGEARWEAPIRSWLHGARNPVLIEVKGRRLLGIAGQVLDPLTGKKIGECPTDDWWAGHHGNRLIVRFERELKIPKDQEAEEEKKYGEGFHREAGVQCLALGLKDDGTLDVKKLWEWSLRGAAEYEPKGVKDFGGPIVAGGYAYTFIGIRTQGNRLLCLDMATGKELWMAKIKVPLGTSHPLYADGKVFVLNNGQLLMIAADPKEYRELGYARVSLQSWAAPALSGGHLFLRDDSGTVKCLDLRAKGEPRKVARPPSGKAKTTDWPRLGGPNGDWTSAEKGLADQWPEAGPKVAWEARAEPGFASPIVAHGHVYLLGRKGWGIKKDKEELHDPRSFLATGNRFYAYRGKGLEAFQVADTSDEQGIECRRLWTAEARPGGTLIPMDDRLVHVAPGGDRRFVRAREAEAGKLLWESRIEKAEVSGGIAADGKVILTTTRNELILAQANGPESRILSRATIDGFESCWSPAAFSKGQLVLRDCTGLVKCFDLRPP